MDHLLSEPPQCEITRLQRLLAAAGAERRRHRYLAGRTGPRHVSHDDQLRQSSGIYRRAALRALAFYLSPESSYEKVDTRWLVALSVELNRRTVPERRV